MSRATMMAALLGMGLAVPDSAAAPAEPDSSAVSASQPAASDAPPTGDLIPGDSEEVTGAPFRVESVDRLNRSLIVRSPDGSRTTIKVAASAAGLEAVEAGDRVALDYYRSSVLSLGPASKKAAVVGTEQEPTRASAPVLGAAGGRQITTKVRITAANSEAGTLQITTADGHPYALLVQDPAARAQLRSVRDGDQLTVTYTEAVAVGVHAGGG